MPVTLLALLIHLCFTMFFKKEGIFGEIDKILKEDLMFLFLTFNYWRDNTSFQGNLWSLCVEEHFYILAPVFLYPIRSNNYRVFVNILLLLVFVMIIRPYIEVPTWAHHQSFLLYASHRKIDEILLGTLIANLQLAGFIKGNWANFSFNAISKFSISIFLTILLLASPFIMPNLTLIGIGNTFYGLISGLMVGIAVLQNGVIFQVPYIDKFFQAMGEKSFCLYLLHIPFCRLLNFYINKFGYDVFFSTFVNSLVLFILFIIFNLIVANFIFIYFESPLLNYGKRLSKKILFNLTNRIK